MNEAELIWSYRTMIVPADQVQLARDLASTITGEGGTGMWTTGLSTDGSSPITHYISSGMIDDRFACCLPLLTFDLEDSNDLEIRYLGKPEQLAEYAISKGLEISVSEVIDLFETVDVSTQDPFVAMGRLGLKMIAMDDPE